MDRQVWIVGRAAWRPGSDTWEWHIQGVFETEALAVAACRDSSYYVGPVTMNVSLPHEGIVWPGVYYPLESTAAPQQEANA